VKLWTKLYFNSNPFSRNMKDVGSLKTMKRHLCNRETFSLTLSALSSTIWSAFLRKLSSPRNHLWIQVQYMGLGQQLRHRLPAHKLRLASVWVFSANIQFRSSSVDCYRADRSNSRSLYLGFRFGDQWSSCCKSFSCWATSHSLIHRHRLGCPWRLPSLNFTHNKHYSCCQRTSYGSGWRQCEYSASSIKYWFTVIQQTAQTLGVSTSVSAFEISDLPSVRVSAAEPRLFTQSSPSIRLPMTTSEPQLQSPLWRLMILLL
jgi:hypothetical protein